MADETKQNQASGEYVVLHDMVSFQDPEHTPFPGQAKNLLFVPRGKVLGGDEHPAPSEQEVKRLTALGAISADKDTLDAKLALSGQRPDTRLSSPYISLTSPAEQVRAAKAIVASGGSSPQSNKRDLARLALGDLKVMAHAFGYADVAESDSKDEIIHVLTGGAEDAQSVEETRNNEQRRDEAQISAREISHEPGLLGRDVTSAGVSATTGEKTEPLGRRQSKVQQSEGEPDATEAAKELAEQEGVDLSQVQGTGAGGRITVDDVKAAAE